MAHLRSSFRSGHELHHIVYKAVFLLLLFLSASMRGAIAQSEKQQTVPIDKQTLTGQLHLISAYGPPGFGETPKIDSRVHYLVLYTKAKSVTAMWPE